MRNGPFRFDFEQKRRSTEPKSQLTKTQYEITEITKSAKSQRNHVEIVSKLHRNRFEIASKLYRNRIKAVSKSHWSCMAFASKSEGKCIETILKLYRQIEFHGNPLEIRVRAHTNGIQVASKSHGKWWARMEAAPCLGNGPECWQAARNCLLWVHYA